MDTKSFAGPRAFARHMLRDGRLQIRPIVDQIMTFRGSAIETVLFREGCWQIELVSIVPGATAEKHRHLRCSSADLILNGLVNGYVGGRTIPSQPKRGSMIANLVTIGRGEWHGGTSGLGGGITGIGGGLVYLSFQQWEGTPTFVSEDWEGENEGQS